MAVLLLSTNQPNNQICVCMCFWCVWCGNFIRLDVLEAASVFILLYLLFFISKWKQKNYLAKLSGALKWSYGTPCWEMNCNCRHCHSKSELWSMRIRNDDETTYETKQKQTPTTLIFSISHLSCSWLLMVRSLYRVPGWNLNETNKSREYILLIQKNIFKVIILFAFFKLCDLFCVAIEKCFVN